MNTGGGTPETIHAQVASAYKIEQPGDKTGVLNTLILVFDALAVDCGIPPLRVDVFEENRQSP